MKPQLSADITIVGFAWSCRAFLVFTVCACVAAGQTAQPLWSFAHANARSLIGMDVRRIRQSSLGRSLEEQWLTNLGQAMPGKSLSDKALLDQVDRVLISSPGSKNAEDPGGPPILIAVRGRFDLTGVRQILREHGAKPQVFDSVTVYRPQGNARSEFAIALMDAQTILGGDAQSVFSAIERRRLPPGESTNSLLDRAAALDAEYDFWALMSAPELASQLPFPGAIQEMVRGVSGFEAGISIRSGLSVNVSILTTTEERAHELRDQLGRLLKLVAKDEAARPELALIAKRPKLSVQGSRVALSIRIDHNELESSLRNLQARVSKKVPVLVPSPPQRQVIRIEGLDGGPRELLMVPNR
jgi:hypothetical protein